MKINNKKRGLKIANIVIWIILIVIIVLFAMLLIPFLIMLLGDANKLI